MAEYEENEEVPVPNRIQQRSVTLELLFGSLIRELCQAFVEPRNLFGKQSAPINLGVSQSHVVVMPQFRLADSPRKVTTRSFFRREIIGINRI